MDSGALKLCGGAPEGAPEGALGEALRSPDMESDDDVLGRARAYLMRKGLYVPSPRASRPSPPLETPTMQRHLSCAPLRRPPDDGPVATTPGPSGVAMSTPTVCVVRGSLRSLPGWMLLPCSFLVMMMMVTRF